jgi:AcrR family transcriptional regulator
MSCGLPLCQCELPAPSQRRQQTLSTARNPSRSAATRARLREAAVDAFARHGFYGTSTRDISAAAGVSSAALYVHFESKEELLYDISLAGHEDTLALVRSVVGVVSEPAEQLRRVMYELSVQHAHKSKRARIVNYELTALSDEHQAAIRSLRREIAAEMRQILDAGVASGSFHTVNSRIVATALLSLAIDIARWFRPDGPMTPDAIGQEYSDMALRLAGAVDASKEQRSARR